MRIDLGSLDKGTKQPMHEQLSALLRGAIRAGIYRPGERIEPERTLARRSQLSQPTVARAIRELAEEGLVVRRAGSGTFVNDESPSPGRRLRRVGVTYYDTRTQYFERLHTGLRDAAASEGIELIPLPAGLTVEHEDRVVALLERERVDAVIASPFGTELMQRELLRLIRAGTTVISIGVQLPRLACDTISVDREMSGQLAGRHLMDLAHRQIAVLCSECVYPDISAIELVAGVRAACTIFDVDLPDERVLRMPLLFDEASDKNQRKRLLQLFAGSADERPTALVCETDGLARYAYEVLGSAGIRVPDDVSIVGGGNLPLAAQLDPPLTTIDWPLERVGRSAIRMLQMRHDHSDRQPIHRLLDTQLVIRRSTRPAQG